MEIIRKNFPYSFGAKDTKELIVKIAVYIVAAFIGGLVLGLLGKLPIVGFIFSFVGGLVDLYCLVGIILAILDYMGALK